MSKRLVTLDADLDPLTEEIVEVPLHSLGWLKVGETTSGSELWEDPKGKVFHLKPGAPATIWIIGSKKTKRRM